jgi:predicted lipoprotein with Yx(FWY)xxD motif
MTGRRTASFLACAAVIPLASLAAAGCGGGGGGGAAAKPSGGASATVSVANTSLGKILVDSQGQSLYLFKADVGTRSTCATACASAWPPLSAHGKPTVGAGASASLVGTTKRPDGGRQVTYNGHPLYRFADDHKPGDVNGQGVDGFGALWFAVSGTGKQISSSSSGGNGGSTY